MKIVSDTEYISKDAFVAQQRKQYCENCERRAGVQDAIIHITFMRTI